MRHKAAVLGLVGLLGFSSVGYAQAPRKEPTPIVLQGNYTDLSEVLDKISAPLKESVVCIRGRPVYTYPVISPLSKDLIDIDIMSGYHGTGFVYDTEVVNGKTEYLILTNNHVAKPADVIIANGEVTKLVKNDLMIVQSTKDENEADAVKLEFIASSPDNDVAILRTKNCPRPLTVYTGSMVSPKENLGLSDVVFTVGFPHGENKVIEEGKITASRYTDTVLTPYINEAWLTTLPIDGGMSGSPVWLPVVTKSTKKTTSVSLHVVGLIYAGAKDNTTRIITPMQGENIQQLLATRKSIPTKRPRLDEPITKDSIETIFSKKGELPAPYYNMNSKECYYKELGENRFALQEFSLSNSAIVKSEYVQVEFSMGKDGLSVDAIVGIKDGARTELVLDEQRKKTAKILYTAVLNHFKHEAERRRLNSMQNAGVDTVNKKEYYGNNADVERKEITPDWVNLHSELYRKGIVSHKQ